MSEFENESLPPNEFHLYACYNSHSQSISREFNFVGKIQTLAEIAAQIQIKYPPAKRAGNLVHFKVIQRSKTDLHSDWAL